ncbi:HAD family hydrolase [Demetria terragena]|uniref:HAD family hydrolase n=1 Tax=Demetria terragena TaxID=63959 RepID=UPI000375E1AA|nr:HAD family phosphatase [Demetria terragena]
MSAILAALWDMDGTLVDTEPYWIGAERELVESFGGDWTDDLAHRCVGNPLLVSGQIIRDNSPVDLTPEEIVDFLLGKVTAQMEAHVPWRPGALELLTDFRERGIACALVTMSYESLAQVLVDQLPAGTFTTLVTGDQVKHGKPHPEAYLTAAQRLGLRPGQCVAFEDSPPGVRSAASAGVPTIAVPHMVPVPDLPLAVRVSSLSGINADTVAELTVSLRD